MKSWHVFVKILTLQRLSSTPSVGYLSRENIVRYAPSLIEAKLLKRYKRFLADVYVADCLEGISLIHNDEISRQHYAFTAHCANPGGMKGLVSPHQRAWLYDSNNPKRKLRYSLELVETVEGAVVCVNTARANSLVAEAIEAQLLPSLNQVIMKPEVKWDQGQYHSRFDFAFWSKVNPSLTPTGYIEVKSVTHALNPSHLPGVVAFPDAVTARGLKHLEALSEVLQQGKRAILCFCVNRDDAQEVRIAEHIDPAYANGLRRALQHGLEVVAVQAIATPLENKVVGLLPFSFD